MENKISACFLVFNFTGNRLHVLLFYYGENSKHAIFSLDQRILYISKVSCFLHQTEKRVHVLIYFILSGVPNMQYVHHPENRLHVLLFYYGKISKHAIFYLDQRTCPFFCKSVKNRCFLRIARTDDVFFLFSLPVLNFHRVSSRVNNSSVEGKDTTMFKPFKWS